MGDVLAVVVQKLRFLNNSIIVQTFRLPIGVAHPGGFSANAPNRRR
jgi:hypothetical protein